IAPAPLPSPSVMDRIDCCDVIVRLGGPRRSSKRRDMTTDALFGLSVLMSFVACALVARRYLAASTDDGPNGCAHRVGHSAHVPVRWTQLPHPGSRVRVAVAGIRGARGVW